jgi:purine-binding chemotaxis protein CheW
MTVTGYCTLTVGDLLVGVEVVQVREVLIDPEITPLPFAPAGVLGLLSRRGEIVAVVDAHERLGTERPTGWTPTVHVLVRLDGETVSLAVDGEGDVVELPAGRLAPVPETVPFTLRRLLQGMAELDDGRLMVALRPEPAREESAR